MFDGLRNFRVIKRVLNVIRAGGIGAIRLHFESDKQPLRAFVFFVRDADVRPKFQPFDDDAVALGSLDVAVETARVHCGGRLKGFGGEQTADLKSLG